ncbi:MAG: thioredoxin [Candidatus Neomarinimicrobiota bacterium]
MNDVKAIRTFTDSNWDQEVKNSDGLVVVDVWAPWCAPCRIIGPVVEALADDYAGLVKIGKLNADDNHMAANLRVSGIPTILFLRDGREVDRVVGAVPRSHLEDKIKYHIGGQAQA